MQETGNVGLILGQEDPWREEAATQQYSGPKSHGQKSLKGYSTKRVTKESRHDEDKHDLT